MYRKRTDLNNDIDASVQQTSSDYYRADVRANRINEQRFLVAVTDAASGDQRHAYTDTTSTVVPMTNREEAWRIEMIGSTVDGTARATYMPPSNKLPHKIPLSLRHDKHGQKVGDIRLSKCTMRNRMLVITSD